MCTPFARCHVCPAASHFQTLEPQVGLPEEDEMVTTVSYGLDTQRHTIDVTLFL